jgi:lipid-A-disaccharide synthase
MAVVGLTEVFSRAPRIVRASLKLKSILKKDRPDLLVLIDYPDFNINLAGTARRFNVPVLYYISPQIWAWRRGRIKKLARRVDRMAVILPFEEAFYLERGMKVEYVGHPLLDTMPQRPDRDRLIREMDLQGARPVLGLLPGSRNEEVRNLLPLMIRAAEILAGQYPDLKCVLPVASTISHDLIQSMAWHASVDIRLQQGDIYRALSPCDTALVASGTATLETALMEVPMVIVYRVSPLSYWIGKRLVRVPHIGLVNLVAGEAIVPELVQHEVTPRRMAREAGALLEGGRRRENMVKKLKDLRKKLGQGVPSKRTAGMVLEMIGE